MEMDKQRIEADGETYELSPWGSEDGAKWQGVIMEHVLNLDVAALKKNEDEEGAGMDALRNVLQPFIRDHWLDFWRVCVRHTNYVAVVDGRETVQPLDRIEKQHMTRKANARFLIMRQHFEAEFGDFLRRGLRDALADLAASTK
jgi:hypothetical protein